MPETPEPPPKPKTKDWVMSSDGRITCYTSVKDRCTVTDLWEGARSPFHDAALQTATREINQILDRVNRANQDPSRHLHFVRLQGRLMLVWAQAGVSSGEDEDKDVAKALKIRGFTRKRSS